MSGIIGLFGQPGNSPGSDVLHRMLARLQRRGPDREAIEQPGPGAMLGVRKAGWEIAQQGGRLMPLMARRGSVTVAADATLYYKQDLQQKLALSGSEPRYASEAELILDAWNAWGERCVEHLEGDFAFIIWDNDTRTAFCARDFGGKRPLHYAVLGEMLVVASTIAPILAHPRCSSELDLTAIAADAAGLFAVGSATAYRAIRRLEAGCSLVWRERVTRVVRFWNPPLNRDASALSFDEAAEELRDLLGRATGERLASGGSTAVWLSGGWDSTAVYASAAAALGSAERLHGISISFPKGDPGREDELIAAVTGRWNGGSRWLASDDMPLLEADPLSRAAIRDEPFAHTFETSNRALAAASRAEGAHVALDGVGGDQLFQVSDVYLADLFITGRWLSLAREWRGKSTRGTGFRNFFRLALQPQIPRPLLRAAALLRNGRPLHGYLERKLPSWIRPEFARQTGLLERERDNTPARTGWSAAEYETRWYLTHPYFPRAVSVVASLALEEGVELRSPLYDARVVAFALSRPRGERASGRETKRLPRRAMTGLLPASVLAPRAHRTGVTSAYFDRALRRRHARLVGDLIDQPLLLAEYGIVNGAQYRRAWNDYLRRGGTAPGTILYLALQAELWLRAHAGAGGRPAAAAVTPSVMPDLVPA